MCSIVYVYFVALKHWHWGGHSNFTVAVREARNRTTSFNVPNKKHSENPWKHQPNNLSVHEYIWILRVPKSQQTYLFSIFFQINKAKRKKHMIHHYQGKKVPALHWAFVEMASLQEGGFRTADAMEIRVSAQNRSWFASTVAAALFFLSGWLSWQ